MKRVACLGWYGHSNFGDTLILKGLEALFSSWNIVPMSSDSLGDYPQLDIDAVNDCDLFVLGGGELINSHFLWLPTPCEVKLPRFAQRLYARSSLAQRPWIHRIKVPKIVLGCGVNVNEASELQPNVIKDLEQFSYIGLRDNRSVEILQSFPQLKGKVGLSYDLAYFLLMPKLRERNRNRAVVIPTDRFTLDDRGVSSAELVSKSRAWLNYYIKEYDERVFLAFGKQDNDDLQTCHSLMNEDDMVMDANEMTVEQVARLIGESAMVLPYRLHGLILAHMLGVPFEFYPYHWKLTRVYETIRSKKLEEIAKEQRAIPRTLLHAV